MFSDYTGESFCSCCPSYCEDAEEEIEPKVVSEIATKGRPYKEIEAIINDHRMVIRMQKERNAEAYDPPCDCLESLYPKSNNSSSSIDHKARDGVIFELTDSRQCDRPHSSRVKKGCEQKDDARTITVFPDPGSKEVPQQQARAAPTKKPASPGQKTPEKKKEKEKHEKKVRTFCKEENPNIFLLRITKKSESGDKKRKFDLEFKAPRPWTHKTDDKEKKSKTKYDEEKRKDKKVAESDDKKKSSDEDAKKEIPAKKRKEKAKKHSLSNKKLAKSNNNQNNNQPKRRSDC